MKVDGDPVLTAAIDMIGNGGGKSFQLRYSDDLEPTVWMAVAEIRGGHWEAAAGMTPTDAAVRLAEALYDNGQCAHCGRTTGVTVRWDVDMPLAEVICWYVYDPETHAFRRSCEGETKGRALGMARDGAVVGRNDPCPCGSGKKWKRCHGAA